jgi:NADP-dependent 3-hydroxy acid dehydrogenase YdfG
LQAVAGSLEGRKAIITGASSGIGEATAVAFAAAGAAVAVGARRKDRLDELVERISGDGGAAHPFGVDVGDEDAARSFVEDAATAMGGLDVLVNNAGVMLLGPIEGGDTEEWRRMIDVNLLGLLYCTHAALPILREGGRGHVVNVASVAGRVANFGSGVYNMTKFGVVAFSESLRQEAVVSESGIRVTCIEPGFVETELQGHNENPVVVENIEKLREQIGEVLTAEDVANAIAYAVGQPDRVGINEILIRPTRQQR